MWQKQTPSRMPFHDNFTFIPQFQKHTQSKWTALHLRTQLCSLWLWHFSHPSNVPHSVVSSPLENRGAFPPPVTCQSSTQTACPSQVDVHTERDVQEINISVDITPGIMMHLCLTLTPRVPGYPTGPWAPSKPCIKKKQYSSVVASSSQQKCISLTGYE